MLLIPKTVYYMNEMYVQGDSKVNTQCQMGVSPKTKAILLQWDSYEELHTGVLLHSTFPVCM